MTPLKSKQEVVLQQPMPSIEPMPPRPGTLWEVAQKQAEQNQREHVAPFAPGVIAEADKLESEADDLEAQAARIRASMLSDISAWDGLLTRLERAQEYYARVQNYVAGERAFAEEFRVSWAQSIASGNYNERDLRSLLCSILAAEAAIPRLEKLAKECQAEIDQANDDLEVFAKAHPQHGLENKLPKKR